MLDRTPSTAAAIAAAPLLETPFPHIIVPNALPTEVAESILQHWPREDQMDPEPGGLGRFLFPIIADHSVRGRLGTWRRHLRLRRLDDVAYWRRLAAGPGRAIVNAALSRFADFNVRRFGHEAPYWTDLSLFESGPTFSQHDAHTHHNHSPGWAVTFLLFLDDGGRQDRGEVFSAPTPGANWLDVVSNGGAIRTRPMKRVPFAPNTLLAWLDGPMSFHGTDTLPLDPVNRRRMLRCHAGVAERVVRRSLGTDSAGFLRACQAHSSGNSADLRSILARPGNCVEALPRFGYADAD